MNRKMHVDVFDTFDISNNILNIRENSETNRECNMKRIFVQSTSRNRRDRRRAQIAIYFELRDMKCTNVEIHKRDRR